MVYISELDDFTKFTYSFRYLMFVRIAACHMQQLRNKHHSDDGSAEQNNDEKKNESKEVDRVGCIDLSKLEGISVSGGEEAIVSQIKVSKLL